jgi:NADPH-dependent curcumin reductase CurA
MADRVNRRILLAARPTSEVTEDCLRRVEEPAPEPGEGEALVRTLYLSLDPTIRGWMNEGEGYMPPIAIGEQVRAGGVCQVVESRSDAYAEGDLLFGMPGWQEWSIVDAGARAMQKLPPGTDPIAALSLFGITGMTAYFGLLDVAKPKSGDTVLVSGAAGATGSVVGQIAKIQGCRVVGIAGTDEKCTWVKDDLGFDACINYRTEDVGKALDAACPDGIDVYFDNVGGEILELALARINQGARVTLCGAISTYNLEEPPPGPKNLMQLVIQRARMEGFIIIDYIPRFPEAMAAMAPWVADGRLKNRVDVVDGIENTPAAFQRLFTGANIGKVLVKVADPA